MPHGYLIDMEGVLYRGHDLIPSADAFIRDLRTAKILFRLLTNNSQRTRPGCGAMVAMLETATGVKAFSVGKPSPIMMRAARKEIGMSTDETIMIGDTMETDILGGVQLGYHPILVLSGGTRREDLPRFT